MAKSKKNTSTNATHDDRKISANAKPEESTTTTTTTTTTMTSPETTSTTTDVGVAATVKATAQGKNTKKESGGKKEQGGAGWKDLRWLYVLLLLVRCMAVFAPAWEHTTEVSGSHSIMAAVAMAAGGAHQTQDGGVGGAGGVAAVYDTVRKFTTEIDRSSNSTHPRVQMWQQHDLLIDMTHKDEVRVSGAVLFEDKQKENIKDRSSSDNHTSNQQETGNINVSFSPGSESKPKLQPKSIIRPTESLLVDYITTWIPLSIVGWVCAVVGAGSRSDLDHFWGHVALYVPRIWMVLLSVLVDLMIISASSYITSADVQNRTNNNPHVDPDAHREPDTENKVSVKSQPQSTLSDLVSAKYAAGIVMASSWVYVLWMIRPTQGAIETLIVVLMIFACFGSCFNKAAKDSTSTSTATLCLMMTIGFLAVAMGLFLKFAYIFHLFSLLTYFYTVAFNSSESPAQAWKKLALGSIIAVILSTVAILKIALLDSIYYGSLMLVDPTTSLPIQDSYTYAFRPFALFSSLLVKRDLLLKGYLTVVPFNQLVAFMQNFRNPDSGYFPDFAQVFITIPLIMGPLTLVLIKDIRDGTKATYKEVLVEYKNITSGAGLGARRRRRKKIPPSARVKEDKSMTFYDIVGSIFLLSVIIDIAFPLRGRTGFASLLPMVAPAALAMFTRVWGSHAQPNLRFAWLVYNAILLVGMGTLLNGASVGSVLQLQNTQSDLAKAIPAGSTLMFYHVPQPAQVHLGLNPLNIRLVSIGGPFLQPSSSLFMGGEDPDFVEHDPDSDLVRYITALDKFLFNRTTTSASTTYLLAPATVQVDPARFSRQLSIKGHYSLTKRPDNFDDIFKRGSLILYKFISQQGKGVGVGSQYNKEPAAATAHDEL